jgi:hypothetical protein
LIKVPDKRARNKITLTKEFVITISIMVETRLGKGIDM